MDRIDVKITTQTPLGTVQLRVELGDLVEIADEIVGASGVRPISRILLTRTEAEFVRDALTRVLASADSKISDGQ